jgi:hypothetical protein
MRFKGAKHMKTTLLVVLIVFSLQFTAYAQTAKTNGSPAQQKASTPAADGVRFKDSGKGTVKDTKTGLIWTKDANPAGKGLNWDDASDYIKAMNKGNVKNFGYTDWRLATEDELKALFDLGPKPGVNPFTNIQRGWCWSSTTTEEKGSTWFNLVGVGGGTVMGTDLTSSIGLVWPVRSGRR